jgi:hypothetical protein
MSWLSSSKVRLALIVNGLYLISQFTMAGSPHKRPSFFERARATRDSRPPQVLPHSYIPLAPPSAPSRASSHETDGMIHVRLTKDLTLVRRPGRVLQLWANFHARTNPPSEPDYVYLTLPIYSDDGECAGDCRLTIAADGMMVWPADYSHSGPTPRAPGLSSRSDYAHFPKSQEQIELDQLVGMRYLDTVSARLTYEQFINIISAKRVVVCLGPDRVELTPDQIEALRDMHRRLPQPPPPPDDSDSD